MGDCMTAQKATFTTLVSRSSMIEESYGPFFGVVGLICGFVQTVGYRYFDKAEWGSELLQEHIAL